MPKSTKKLRSNRAWIERHINDPFVKKSRAEGYRARSAYKLLELNEKEKLFHPGVTVVDLGSAPGSWTQVARSKMVDAKGVFSGRLISMDILPMNPLTEQFSFRVTSENSLLQTDSLKFSLGIRSMSF